MTDLDKEEGVFLDFGNLIKKVFWLPKGINISNKSDLNKMCVGQDLSAQFFEII